MLYIDLQMVLGFQPHSSLLPLTVKPRARPKFYKQSSFFHVPPSPSCGSSSSCGFLWAVVSFAISSINALLSLFSVPEMSCELSSVCACLPASLMPSGFCCLVFIYLFIIIIFCLVFIVPFSSVSQSHPTLCDSMNHSTPGLPVHHQLPESTQTHVHRVSDAIQPSRPLLSPSLPALNLSQHQGLFQSVRSSPQVAKVLEFQLQHQSFQ